MGARVLLPREDHSDELQETTWKGVVIGYVKGRQLTLPHLYNTHYRHTIETPNVTFIETPPTALPKAMQDEEQEDTHNNDLYLKDMLTPLPPVENNESDKTEDPTLGTF